MAKPLISDELWDEIVPLLPERRPKLKGGRPRLCDRKALTGILFILKSGLPWEMLPQEMGCGSGMTCWRRLRDWMEAGVWDKIHGLLLNRLQRADQLNWSRASTDFDRVPSLRTNTGEARRHAVPSEPSQPGRRASFNHGMRAHAAECAPIPGKHARQ